nr:unnamed protein product [Fusarium pseudograminearum CS3487]
METDADALSFWKPKPHDTAKLPAAYRRLVLYRAKNLLDKLLDIRDVAMEYASEDALVDYAKECPLPSPDGQEEEDLADSLEESESDEDSDKDIGTYEAQIAQHEYGYMGVSENIDVANQQGGNASTGTTDTDMEDAEPIWDGAIHGFDWPNVEEPSTEEPFEHCSEFSNGEDEMIGHAEFDTFEASTDTTAPESSTWLTNTPYTFHGTFYNTFVTFPSSYDGDEQAVLSTAIEYSDVSQGPASAWLTNDPNALNGVAEAETSSESSSDDETSSLPTDQHLPTFQDKSDNEEDEESWIDNDSSDEISSQDIHDELKRLRLAPTTLLHPHGWYWPTHFLDEIVTHVKEHEKYLQKKKALVKSITQSKNLSPGETDNILCEFVHKNLVRKPVVDTAQLFKLKRFVDNVVRFVLATQRNIDAIDADMDEGRKRHFSSLNSTSRFRSKRLGSSLRFVTSINDDWGQVYDNWGMPPVKKKREQI